MKFNAINWLLGLMFFLEIDCSAQRHFTLITSIGTQSVQVNGTIYQVDSNGIRIKTNYPQLDTLIFKSDVANVNDPILCNFKPDSTYAVSVACCGSLDLIKASRLNNDSLKYWDPETDLEKIHNQLMVKPFLSISTKQKTKDSIYAWHADAACNTEHKLISTKPWQLGIPPKCFYWSNITYLLFFKTNQQLPPHKKTDTEEFLGIDNIVVLKSIGFILFDEEKFMLTYDEKKNEVSITYEKN